MTEPDHDDDLDNMPGINAPGYWWVLNFARLDDVERGSDQRQDLEVELEAEIVMVREGEIEGHGPALLVNELGDTFPQATLLFHPLKQIDTSDWPTKKQKIDPASVEEGYWWAFHILEDAPEIVRIRDKVALRADSDGGEDLASFKFVMKIDTSQWPRG